MQYFVYWFNSSLTHTNFGFYLLRIKRIKPKYSTLRQQTSAVAVQGASVVFMRQEIARNIQRYVSTIDTSHEHDRRALGSHFFRFVQIWS